MSIYFFQFRLLHISTRADSDPLNFLEKEAICFLNRFIYWKLLLTGIRSSEQTEFLMLTIHLLFDSKGPFAEFIIMF